MESKLWYTAPASNWNEALPLGNGSLGVMVFGGVQQERLALNMDTLWSGVPRVQTPKDTAAEYAQIVRDTLDGHYAKAQTALERDFCGGFHQGYLPMGNLTLGRSLQGGVTQYQRALDLEKGWATVDFHAGEVAYKETCFVSAPHKALVVRLGADAPVLSCTAALDSQLQGAVSSCDNLLLFTGECPTHTEPNYVESTHPVVYEKGKHGVGFCFGVSVTTDGKAKISHGRMEISDAKEILLLLTAETSFRDYKTNPHDPSRAYATACTNRLHQLRQKTFAQLYHAHFADYTALEGRCSLYLDNHSPAADLPTDQRLKGFAQDNHDVGLAALLFRYGRYLLLSSSREGTQPANLQGIWNQQLRAPWSANYTLNINTEMNYWHVFTTNLTECAKPFVELVQDLSQSGSMVAKQMYGARGFVCHHNTDLWRAATPVGNHADGCACYGFWNMGAAWLCRTIYEYYQYTGDTAYLEKTGLPIMEDAAQFVLDILREHKGLIVCPATSPENSFLLDERAVSVSKSTAMSQSIAWDLLDNCRRACIVLGKKDAAARYAEVLSRLQPLQIGEDGRILEWDSPVQEVEPHHRHLSHLYGLHPAQQITPTRTPLLASACKKSLELRGDAGTGWSLGWKINLWARLLDGERAYNLLTQQLHFVDSRMTDNFAGGGTYPNLLCAHPPFQIDGNFGAAAGIGEMLVQSDESTVTLLPALPRAWSSGSITGMLTRTACQVQIFWENHTFQKGFVTAKKDGTYRFSCHGKTWTQTLCAGKTTPLAYPASAEKRKTNPSSD